MQEAGEGMILKPRQWQVPRDHSSAAETWTRQGTGPLSVNSGASGTYQSLRGEKCTPLGAVSLTHTWNRNWTLENTAAVVAFVCFRQSES